MNLQPLLKLIYHMERTTYYIGEPELSMPRHCWWHTTDNGFYYFFSSFLFTKLTNSFHCHSFFHPSFLFALCIFLSLVFLFSSFILSRIKNISIAYNLYMLIKLFFFNPVQWLSLTIQGSYTMRSICSSLI